MSRIVHIVTGLGTGGAEMMLSKLLAGTVESGNQQVVISIADKGTLGETIEALGIPLYTLGLKHQLLAPFYTIKLIKLLNSLSPDLIMGWMYNANFATQISSLGLKRKVPVVWNIRGDHTDLSAERLRISLLIWLGGKLSHMPDAIINNSKVSTIAHQQKFGYRPGKMGCIPNGL